MTLFRPALEMLGAWLIILAALMLVPLSFLLIQQAPDWQGFLIASVITAIVGGLSFYLNKGSLARLTPRHMFLVTAVNWILIPVFAALPFLLSGLGFSVTDSVFESVSGFTTTGSTVIAGLDQLPKDILLWRSITQWLGGIGFIGMAVAILPFLRVGGMRLFQTESSDWSEKSMPRARTLLSALVATYIVLTALCMMCYAVSGMDWFDAVNHAMTTISTGGYSTSDASMGHFNNPWLHWEATLFMLLGSIPFILYVKCVLEKKISILFDSQVKAFLVTLCTISLLLTGYLHYDQGVPIGKALTLTFFNITSVITTTGYATTDYTLWGGAAVLVFFFSMFIGGCSGSTSGGIKVFRFQLFFLMLYGQLIKSVHPRAVVALRYNDRVLSEDVISSSIAFMFVAMASYCVLAVALSLCGLDFMTSISGSLTALMNVGPGLGEVIGPAGNFKTLPDAAKWILCIGMTMGRLEYLAIVMLFSRMFWRG